MVIENTDEIRDERVAWPGLRVERTPRGFLVEGPEGVDNFTHIARHVEELEHGLNELVLPAVRQRPDITLPELMAGVRKSMPELPQGYELPRRGLFLLTKRKRTHAAAADRVVNDPALKRTAELLGEWYLRDRGRRRLLAASEPM